MKDKLEELQSKIGTLVNWVSEMQTIIENPYSAGLNVQKMLKDLQGYGQDLSQSVYSIQQLLEEERAAEEADPFEGITKEDIKAE